jgi:DNA-binding NtrC family response regulator
MQLKILIVDDDDNLITVLKSILLEEKHDVTACQDGLAAIEKCREEKFDLVITDLMMPGAGGLEVLTACHKIHPETLVILITGFASLETATEAIRQGAYDYITKPFKLEELKIVVNNARERIQLFRENQKLFRDLDEAHKQLQLLKKIMGAMAGTDPNLENSPGTSRLEPLIAGSLMPPYYIERKAGVETPFFSDLEKIAALREKGFLSEKEFNLCKSKLFQSLTY